MSFVQSQSLSELICVNCKHYLSHFPIHFHPEKGSYCGRCQIPNDENIIRNHIYEHLAQTQKFPCSYNSNGCTENLVPSKIPQHEKFCNFKKYDCPVSSFTNCEWKGLVKDLLDHFEQKHPTFILRDGQFELDFINSHKENYLLPFGEDLFVVNRMNDSKTNTFSITVTYIGSNKFSENYSYKLILENGTKSHFHELTRTLQTQTDINGEFIRNILNDPTSVIARIEVVEQRSDDKGKDEEEDETYNSAVNFELLRELECLVCMEYMVPPIYQCITGHSICSKCKNDVTECPTCRQEFKNTQNFALAQIVNYITYPCKHDKCRFTATAKEIKQHEASCVYGPFRCPLSDYENCNIEVPFSEISDHIINNHYENLLEMDTVNLPFEFTAEDEDKDCYILKYAFKLFKLHYLFRDDIFYWAMQLIGPPEESVKYKFEIDVIDNSGNNFRAYFKSSCSPLCDKANAFNDDKSFIYLNHDQIESMITNEFSYRVRVLQD